jgi:hypothetical protein
MWGCGRGHKDESPVGTLKNSLSGRKIAGIRVEVMGGSDKDLGGRAEGAQTVQIGLALKYVLLQQQYNLFSICYVCYMLWQIDRRSCLGVVLHACNPTPWEAKVGGS